MADEIEFDTELAARLDDVCQRYHIATREQAMEFLIKRRLRRGARQIAGRGRALHITRNRDDA